MSKETKENKLIPVEEATWLPDAVYKVTGEDGSVKEFASSRSLAVLFDVKHDTVTDWLVGRRKPNPLSGIKSITDLNGTERVMENALQSNEVGKHFTEIK